MRRDARDLMHHASARAPGEEHYRLPDPVTIVAPDVKNSVLRKDDLHRAFARVADRTPWDGRKVEGGVL